MTPKQARQLADEDLRAVLGLPAGRRLFVRLLTQAGLYGPSFSADSHAMAYTEGRRSFAIGLMREAQRVSPPLYAQALKEQLDVDAQALGIEEPAPEE